MKRATDSERCAVCNHTETVAGRTHYECSRCGLERDPLEADPGFTPGTLIPTISRTYNNNSLGTNIAWSRQHSSEKLRRSHERATSERPLFIDQVISEIYLSCGNNRISSDASDLVIRVNAEVSIGRMRRKMHGSSGMSPEDSKSYRTKVYAAAALHIRRSDGQVNTAHRISTAWGINHFDLVAAIRTMNRVLKPIRSIESEDPTNRRIRALNSESEVIRQFLNQLIPIPESAIISEIQIRILRESGEPFYHGDHWNNGRFTNETTDKAVFMATIEAMAETGTPFIFVEELYHLHPVRGLQTWVQRSRKALFD